MAILSSFDEREFEDALEAFQPEGATQTYIQQPAYTAPVIAPLPEETTEDPFAVPSWVTDPAQIQRADIIRRLAAGEQIPGWEWFPESTRTFGESEVPYTTPASAFYQGQEYRPGGFAVENQSLWDVIKEAAPLAAIMGGAYLGGLGLESMLGSGAGTVAGTTGAGGLEAALADAAAAAASGTTPEALAAWASSAGIGTGELAALGSAGLGAGTLTGAGGLEAALADAAAAAASGTTPEALAAWGSGAGVGTGELAALGSAGAGAGGLEAALADAAAAAASGTTPEALAAWGSSAGVGTGELAALGAGAGAGGLEAALADAAAAAASGTTPEALAAWGSSAGVGTGELAALGSAGLGGATAAGLSSADKAALFGEAAYGPGMTGAQTAAYDAVLNATGSKVLADLAGSAPSWLANAGTTALNAFQKNPLGMIAAGASLLGGDSIKGGGGGIAGGSATPVNMNLMAQRTMLPQPEYKPYSGEAVMGRQFFSPVTYSNQPAAPVNPVTPEPIMEVGPAQPDGGLAAGGKISPARYLRGITDGMADKIPSSIDGQQPAKLSHGEFVIPADVVSHLGNGNSDAGAKVLYKMMDRVRQARTGTKQQGKRIQPEKFMPGGIAGYAGGGAVAFSGETGSAVTLPGTGDLGTTQSSTLSPWAAPYVTNLLSQGQALGSMPYQAYTGPLSAGVSPLQQTAFQGAQGLGGTFDTAAAQQYMNPYLEQALNPQLDLLRRQADISLQGDLSKYTQAGAFGGSRAAIAQGLNRENLGQQMERVTGQGYKDAYDRAMQQFNTQQRQNIENVQAQATLGGQQRDIEQQGISALRGEFETQRDYPQRQLAFQQSLLKGLPISTQTTSPLTSGLGSVLGDVAGAASIYKLIGDLFGD